MIKAIIFDVFGVLITDALGPMAEALRATNPAGANQIYDLVNATSRGDVSREEFTEQVAAMLGMEPDKLRATTDRGEVKNAPLLALIKTLRARYRVGVLSNISVGAFERRFTLTEITEHFDVVVPSGEIGYIKPEPEAYLITTERLSVKPSECVMVDDRQSCVDGARAVGMHAIVYTSLAELEVELAELGVTAKG